MENRAVPLTRYALFGCLAAGGCAADLISKTLVFQWRGMPREDNVYWLWEGYVGIETALNNGALFGLGQGGSQYFAALSVVAAIGICVWLFRFGAAHDRFLTIALGCVMGGVLGNLYDRLGLWSPPAGAAQEHYTGVRDWILWRYGKWTWPNFNIADCLLVCGAFCLVCQALMVKDVGDGDSNESSKV